MLRPLVRLVRGLMESQLAQAFGPDQFDQTPPAASLEPVTEEVEMTVGGVHVHHAGFVRMQCESGSGHPFPERFKRGGGLFPATAEHDHVVGIPHHFQAASGHQPVQRIEIHVS